MTVIQTICKNIKNIIFIKDIIKNYKRNTSRDALKLLKTFPKEKQGVQKI